MPDACHLTHEPFVHGKPSMSLGVLPPGTKNLLLARNLLHVTFGVGQRGADAMSRCGHGGWAGALSTLSLYSAVRADVNVARGARRREHGRGVARLHRR